MTLSQRRRAIRSLNKKKRDKIIKRNALLIKEQQKTISQMSKAVSSIGTGRKKKQARFGRICGKKTKKKYKLKNGNRCRNECKQRPYGLFGKSVQSCNDALNNDDNSLYKCVKPGKPCSISKGGNRKKRSRKKRSRSRRHTRRK